MSLLNQIVLLFGLNLLDALLTILWVRNGIASEGNRLMAELLDIGNLPFLIVKIAIGAFAAFVLLKFSHKRLARYGLTASLSAYIALMFIHLFTGLNAFGYLSNSFWERVGDIPAHIFALI